MTIAIGLLGKGCLVLASDSQETQGGQKTDVAKIATFDSVGSGKRNCCAVAGAGYPSYIDRVTETLEEVFVHEETVYENWRPSVEEQLTDFHARHVIPFTDPDLDFALLIATCIDGKFQLLETDKSVALKRPEHGAVGVGAFAARQLLERLHWPKASADVIVATAAYIIWKIKKSVTDCGHFTDIKVVTPHFSVPIARSAPALMETLFPQLEDLSMGAIVCGLDRFTLDLKAEEKINKFRADMLDKLRQFNANLLSLTGI